MDTENAWVQGKVEAEKKLAVRLDLDDLGEEIMLDWGEGGKDNVEYPPLWSICTGTR